LPRVLAKVRHLFDVNSDPLAIFETLAIMNEIRPGLCVLGTRLPGSFNAFETSVRAILGQQVSVQAARVLASRLVATFGEEAQTPIEGLTRTFPAPTDILSLGEAITDRLGSLGVISSRSQTIYELALALSSGKIDLETPGRPLEEIEKLLAIRGIGPWTANYIAMRVMGWPDVFLPTDVGVKNALKPYEAKDLAKMAESWRPFRSYATMSLWNSL
jgi:AraC family transcriptional regulator of adaptative response / DNA-3-methyladenine glycosylase II